MFEISYLTEWLVTTRFDPKPIQLNEIFEYLFNKRNIYKEGMVSRYENVAFCSVLSTKVLTLNST